MARKKKVNYQQLFAIQAKLEEQLRRACPKISHKSGIYFYIREDEIEGKKYSYIGKASDLISRNISHLQGYKQHIDISLKKRGFYSEQNKIGWKLNVLEFPKDQLDEKESYYIDLYKNQNYEMLNIESGGTTGKTIIGERKPSKTYTDGLKQGQKKTTEQVRTYFDKYLNYTIKQPSNKIKERKLEEFRKFLEGDNGNEE